MVIGLTAGVKLTGVGCKEWGMALPLQHPVGQHTNGSRQHFLLPQEVPGWPSSPQAMKPLSSRQYPTGSLRGQFGYDRFNPQHLTFRWLRQREPSAAVPFSDTHLMRPSESVQEVRRQKGKVGRQQKEGQQSCGGAQSWVELLGQVNGACLERGGIIDDSNGSSGFLDPSGSVNVVESWREIGVGVLLEFCRGYRKGWQVGLELRREGRKEVRE